MTKTVFVLSDFGCRDTYSGQMKAALLAELGPACLVDLTPGVPPGDIRAGAFHLMVSIPHLAPGTGVLAVVDPGVGTSRRLILADSGGVLIAAPDNGLLGWVRLDSVREIPSGHPESMTFHGRDVIAPALGRALREPGWAASLPAVDPSTVVVLPQGGHRLSDDRMETSVAHVDVFGNCILWLRRGDLGGRIPSEVINTRGSSFLVRSADTYGPAGPGLLLIEGSSGMMELALSGGSAAYLAGLAVEDVVHLRLS
jgi:hypothetical protein